MTEHWSCDCRPGIEETIAIGRAVGHLMTHFVAYRHDVPINSCLKVSHVIRFCLTKTCLICLKLYTMCSEYVVQRQRHCEDIELL